MSWPSLETLPPVDLAHLGDLKPMEVLYDFDGPCIFTARTPAGLLLLAFLVEELDPEAIARFLVATSSHQTLDGLREGALSVRAALLGGSLWLVDLGQADALPKRAYQIEATQLPPDALPAPATMLLPELSLCCTSASAATGAAIMESLRLLAPPTTATGPVTNIEVSGSMLGHPRQPYRLTQQTAKRIRTLLSTINRGQDIRLKVFEGRIRSLDLDLLTLTFVSSPGG